MQQSFQAEKALGYVQVTATSTAFTIAPPSGTILAIIIPEAQAVRWRDDGVSPTATVGYPLAVGAELRYTAAAMGKFMMIAQTAGAIVNIAFYGALGS